MAYSFNGTTDHLELASAVLTATPLSIFARFIADTVAGTQTIVAISGSAGTHAFQLRRNASNVEAVTSEGATSAAAAVTGVVTGTQLSAMAVFTSAANRRIYLSPAATANETTSVTPTSLNRTNVGARYNAAALGAFFNGKICEVGIWSAALTAGDFDALQNGASPLVVKPASLVAYLPLVRDTIDRKASRSLTITGALPSAHHRVRYPATGF